MILSFTAINANTEFREFFCQLTELEDALDVLNAVVSQGDRLVHAHLVDGKSSMELPINVFDGQPFCTPLKQLESQWREILREPVGAPRIDNTWYIELTRQRLRLYERKIEQYRLTVCSIEKLCQRAETEITNEVRRLNRIYHYNSLLTRYHQFINLARTGQRETMEKLSQLES